MEYIPTEFQGTKIQEIDARLITSDTYQVISRRISVNSFRIENDMLVMVSDHLNFPMKISCGSKMKFGSETITAIDYFRRVIEKGDLIDTVLSRFEDECLYLSLFWIHIEYVGSPSQAGSFSKKDDGLFAMRTKSGEKAERVVTKELIEKCSHKFHPSLSESPGFFEIRYQNKRVRKPDRICELCGLTFEVKKRNKDQHFRVSHSENRTFDSENTNDGWHAFVFPDMKPRYIPNRTISHAISSGQFIPGQDRYDSWVDVDHLEAISPPKCN